MVKCPSCETEIDIEFGMVNCASCDAVFMVDFEGNIQAGVEDESEGESGNSEVIAEAVELSVVSELSAIHENIETIDNNEANNDEVWAPLPLDDEDESSDFEAVDLEADISMEDSDAGTDTLENEDNDEVPGYSESFLESHLDPDDEEILETEEINSESPELTVVEEASASDPKDPLGVTEFDQADVSQLPEGPYYYDVQISGLDTIGLKRDVIGQLGDRRFGWNQEELKRNIKNGNLVLEHLNPVKAVVAVMKLQSLDIDISWTQKLFTDESLVEKGDDDEGDEEYEA